MSFEVWRKSKPNTALFRYGQDLGRLVDQRRTNLALRIAKNEAEAASRRANAAMLEAEAASAAKTHFLSNMSHELRTPLNAIIGFSEILQALHASQGADDDHASEYIDTILQSGTHLLDIINDILDTAKIESGEIQLDKSPFSVSQSVSACLAMVASLVEEKNLKISNEIPDNFPSFLGDERRFNQIVLNILSNSIKYNSEDGQVTLKAKIEDSGNMTLSFGDTGVGMDQADIPKALAPFQQVGTEHSRLSQGTGLGLPIAKAFVELQDGSFDLESEPGVGTTVKIQFPAHRVIDRKNERNQPATPNNQSHLSTG